MPEGKTFEAMFFIPGPDNPLDRVRPTNELPFDREDVAKALAAVSSLRGLSVASQIMYRFGRTTFLGTMEPKLFADVYAACAWAILYRKEYI